MMLPLFPLLLLVTAIASFICYQKTGNDIFGALAVASTIAVLIWGFVIAHWSVHLLALILLFKFRSPLLNLVQVELE